MNYAYDMSKSSESHLVTCKGFIDLPKAYCKGNETLYTQVFILIYFRVMVKVVVILANMFLILFI